MNAIERMRPTVIARSNRDHSEVDSLRRQLRRANEQRTQAFDQGFQAAVRMVEGGADLERLKAASGVVAIECDDTEPTVAPTWDEDDTAVEVLSLPYTDS